jgi:GntR family transcriptional regulator/MocR family aminotransferase
MGKPIPSLQSIDVMDKVIYMNTFTKSLAPTIRISYMVLPVPLLKVFNQKLGFYSCTVSNFEQYTLAKFIKDGHFEKHINRMRIFYRNQRDLLIDAIERSHLSKIVTIQEKNAGLHFLMTVNTTLSDDELIEKAHNHGLKIACLSQYYYNTDNAVEHTLVINYSAIEPEKIEEAVALLAKCVC